VVEAKTNQLTRDQLIDHAAQLGAQANQILTQSDEISVSDQEIAEARMKFKLARMSLKLARAFSGPIELTPGIETEVLPILEPGHYTASTIDRNNGGISFLDHLMDLRNNPPRESEDQLDHVESTDSGTRKEITARPIGGRQRKVVLAMLSPNEDNSGFKHEGYRDTQLILDIYEDKKLESLTPEQLAARIEALKVAVHVALKRLMKRFVHEQQNLSQYDSHFLALIAEIRGLSPIYKDLSIEQIMKLLSRDLPFPNSADSQNHNPDEFTDLSEKPSKQIKRERKKRTNIYPVGEKQKSIVSAILGSDIPELELSPYEKTVLIRFITRYFEKPGNPYLNEFLEEIRATFPDYSGFLNDDIITLLINKTRIVLPSSLIETTGTKTDDQNASLARGNSMPHENVHVEGSGNNSIQLLAGDTNREYEVTIVTTAEIYVLADILYAMTAKERRMFGINFQDNTEHKLSMVMNSSMGEDPNIPFMRKHALEPLTKLLDRFFNNPELFFRTTRNKKARELFSLLQTIGPVRGKAFIKFVENGA
jgi:hypothetical protein